MKDLQALKIEIDEYDSKAKTVTEQREEVVRRQEELRTQETAAIVCTCHIEFLEELILI